MPSRYLRPGSPTDDLRADFDRIRAEFDVTIGFPDDVAAEAEQHAQAPLDTAGRVDLTDVPWVTIDPPGSMDLDQAMHLERTADGFVVRYAIADVAAHVPPGSLLEQEAWKRGTTVYCPDIKAPLYPTSLSEGAASLLPDQTRPAIVFTIQLDAEGERTSARVERATVRSTAKLAYGSAEVPHLEEVGRLRMAIARRRGAVSLNAPAQEVIADPSSPLGYRLELEPRVESEDWNAEISLLAGMAAADLMVERGFGLLRVMGGADEYRLTRLRRVAHGLHVEWPEDEPYRDFVDRLDPARPRDAAILEEARGVMGHASYLYFDGAPPKDAIHAGIAARYAHTTAPLRRLADRYVLDLLAGGGDRGALERLPKAMAEAQTRGGRVEHAVIDLMETRMLEHRIGERFEATPLEEDRRGTVIQIAEPPVRARLHADPRPPLGRRVAVLLVRADPRSRSLEFRPAPTS